VTDDASAARKRELLYLNREGCLCGLAREFWNDQAKLYADAHLAETGRKADGWEILYRCPRTGAEWLEDRPLSEEHGGGPVRLRRTDAPE
jgi:hypothetical protein